MGYRRQTKTYKLVFRDEEFDGLEVRAKSMPLGVFLDMEAAAFEADRGSKEKGLEMMQYFSDVLTSWNVEDEKGNPVPTTVDGLLTQDFDFVQEIIATWKLAMIGVDAPLRQNSPGGEQFQEGLIPMETWSEGQAS